MRLSKVILILVFALLVMGLNAYQRSFFSLVTPTELGTLDSELDIQHRFKGRLDGALSNFFGMDDGANVGLIYRQAIIKSFDLRLGHISKQSEYFVELGWRFSKEEWPVQAQANVQYFAFENPLEIDKNRQNMMVILSAQNRPEWNRLLGNINLGYDADKERFLTGIGAGVVILNNLAWMIEYFPVWDRNSDKLEGQIGDHNSFSTGLNTTQETISSCSSSATTTASRCAPPPSAVTPTNSVSGSSPRKNSTSSKPNPLVNGVQAQR